MSRDPLHDLIGRILEEELPAARRFLEYLAISPAYRAALSAPIDDEPLTEGTPRRSHGRTTKFCLEKSVRMTKSCGNSACDEVYLAGLRTIRVAGN